MSVISLTQFRSRTRDQLFTRTGRGSIGIGPASDAPAPPVETGASLLAAGLPIPTATLLVVAEAASTDAQLLP
jgi:hypothetical protein